MRSIFRALFGASDTPQDRSVPDRSIATRGRPVNLALLGASGSGKGTHIPGLRDVTGAVSIGAGDLLRANLQNGTPSGVRARSYMDAAEMVPDELVDTMMEEWIGAQDAASSMIFDGFPRTVYQARFLDRTLRERGGLLDTAVYFEISDDDLAARLTGRLICTGCNATYHEQGNPPRTKGRCDKCGDKLTRRADDTPELIHKRLRVFHREIGPVLTFYHRSGRLRTVAADAPIAEIAGALVEVTQATQTLALHAPPIAVLETLGAAVGKAPKHDAAAFPAMDIVLLGGPGSGKGTQAKQLCDKLGLPHISTGDLFRENLRNETELGKLAKTYMDRGELVPDDVTESMVEERLGRSDTEKGFVLDGFPRSLAQAEALTEMLDGLHRRLSLVIHIDVPDEAIIDRLSGRLICRDCQSPFHRQFKPPRVEGKCDECGGELYQRDDDNPETIGSRLKVFHSETEPLIRYYRAADLVRDVDGQAARKEVHDAIMVITDQIMAAPHSSG